LLESHIQGDYILGDNITLADIFVYPWMVRCCVLDCFFGVKIDPKFVKVCKWVENMRQREAVKGTIEPNEVYVEAFKKRFTE
jgi:glutathione S-transferase